ncbi:hypothetical protein HDU96_007907 [Phlyctochytrium bullatum]|nr:hypothetical protein HDU96_007907 [Phlyctochytrium bullatum]
MADNQDDHRLAAAFGRLSTPTHGRRSLPAIDGLRTAAPLKSRIPTSLASPPPPKLLGNVSGARASGTGRTPDGSIRGSRVRLAKLPSHADDEGDDGVDEWGQPTFQAKASIGQASKPAPRPAPSTRTLQEEHDFVAAVTRKLTSGGGASSARASRRTLRCLAPAFALQVSERPLYCMAAMPPSDGLPALLAVGGADHGLSAVCLDGPGTRTRGNRKHDTPEQGAVSARVAAHLWLPETSAVVAGRGRTRPARGQAVSRTPAVRSGHREWVTCVRGVPTLPGVGGGSVQRWFVSGGMDARVCVWCVEPAHASAVVRAQEPVGVVARPDGSWRVARCLDLDGHEGSVSAVRGFWAAGSLNYRPWDGTARGEEPALSSTFLNSVRVVSSSYDGSLKIWNPGLCGSLENPCLATLSFGKVPLGIYDDGKGTPSPWWPSTSAEFRNNALLGVELSSSQPYAVTWTKDGRLGVVDLVVARSIIGSEDSEAARRQKSLSAVIAGSSSSSLSPPVLPTIQAHHGPVTAARFIDDSGHVIASAGLLDGSVRCFDVRIPASRGRCIGRLEKVHGQGGITFLEPSAEFLCPETSSDGRCFLTMDGSGSGEVAAVRLGGRKQLVRLEDRIQPREGGASSTFRSNLSRPRPTSPSTTAYSLYPFQTESTKYPALAVAWGDGRVSFLSANDSSAGHSSSSDQVRSEGGLVFQSALLDAAEYGVRNAIRSLHLVHKTDVASGCNSSILTGVGDDGIIIGWPI